MVDFFAVVVFCFAAGDFGFGFAFPAFELYTSTFGFDAVFLGAAAVFFVVVAVDFVGILTAVDAALAVALVGRVDVAVDERRRQAASDVEEHLPL